MTAPTLLLVEMRRALHRRVLRVLVALGLVGAAVFGVAAFASSAGRTPAELHVNGAHPAVMADWWLAGTGDGALLIAVVPLLLGALAGGAAVAGGEWRAGTVTTLLTWEPRRLRLHAARTGAAVLLAVAIAAGLLVLFLVAAVPAVLAHGTTAGVDGAWWADLAAAVGRVALLAGVAAAAGMALATLGRNTAFALGATFAWMAAGEGLVRSLKPSVARHLLGENLAVVLTWAPLEGAPPSLSTPLAALTVAGYVGLLAAAATLSFARRDIAGGA